MKKNLSQTISRLFGDLKWAVKEFWVELTSEIKSPDPMEQIATGSCSTERLFELIESDDWNYRHSAASKLIERFVAGRVTLSDVELDKIIIAYQDAEGSGILDESQLEARSSILKLERYAMKTENGELMRQLFAIRMQVWQNFVIATSEK